MKIKARVQEYNAYGADFKSLQIIEHPYRGSLSIKVIGYVHFRIFNGDDEYLYVDSEVKSDEHRNFTKMAKIMKVLHKYMVLEDALEVLGAELYELKHSEFVKVNDAGKSVYNVHSATGSLERRVIAIDVANAKRQAKRLKVSDGFTITPVGLI